MNFKLAMSVILTVSTISASPSVFANDYQTFANFNYFSVERQSNGFSSDVNGYNLGVNHFFDRKQSLGPLAEFEYINKVSHVFAGYADKDNANAYNVGGNYFTGDFLIGANYQNNDDYDSKSFNLGYLINDDLLVKVTATDPELGDTIYNLSAQYNHRLGGNDYLGFTYLTNDEIDYQTIASTYFTQLEGDHYLKLSASYFDSDFGNSWDLDASYYLNKMTSFSIGTSKYSEYTLGASHYFNDNFAVQTSYYVSDENGIEVKSWQIGLFAQF